MRILIYGAGAMGLYLSARLSQAGHSVSLKARGAPLERAESGVPITVTSGEESQKVSGVKVIAELDPDSETYDLVILTTKAWQVAEAAAETAPVLGEEGRLLTIQNGVDASAQAAQHIPAERVLAGTAVVITERTGPLAVALTGAEAHLMLGPWEPSADQSDAGVDTQQLTTALRRAGILAQWNEDIYTAVWKKLALVASYGGVGALSGAPVGVTRAVPQTKALIRNAMLEVFNVGNARGATLQEQDLEDIMGTFTQKFGESTTASLQRDLAAGRPSELREQIGAVVAHARELGVDVPIFETIYASQLPRELQARAAVAQS